MKTTKSGNIRRMRRGVRCGLVSLSLLMLAGEVGAASRLTLESLSNRPDKLSGGDVLIRIGLPTPAAAKRLRVTLNDTDVSAAFRPSSDGRALIGLVEGLRDGRNRLVAHARGTIPARLELVSHPLSGPVFAGPKQEPFVCETAEFQVYPGGGTLGAPLDENCTVQRRVDYLYRTTSGAFRPYNPAVPPGDLAVTTTLNGATVPYVVRLETGTINRAIYQTAVLDNPGVPGPSIFKRDGAWNGRLVYNFGGGCRSGWYRQGNGTGGVLDHRELSRGFATASASLNVFGNNCDDLLAAETMMMVKERFIETYGRPRYTIGWGCSGGSYQQHQIGDNYPGLLDGIIPSCSFPEVAFGTAHTLADSRLLWHYYQNAGVDWTEEQLRAASGFGVFATIPNLDNGAARLDPVPGRPDRASAEFDASVDPSLRYHPTDNPRGARATIYDHAVNSYGIDRETGFARRPLDNVGIQYGLEALNTGQISKAQFLDLNEKIGGMDIDANFISQRMTADLRATFAAYRTGRMLNGGGGLASMPILDYDQLYTDLQPGGDIHLKFHHFSTRERLRKANGHVYNHVMWSGGSNAADDAAYPGRVAYIQDRALEAMDRWLAAIVADRSNRSRAEKVVRNKPANLQDGCWTRESRPDFIPEPQRFGGPGTSACNDLYPAFPSPRMVAGGPLASDIIKCELKAIDHRDYSVAFSGNEYARLTGIFPNGVCNWDAPGVGQTRLLGTWLEYTGVGRYHRDRRPHRR
ncbi:tannase/feruloyl esterase family alpha/beta hydrolase [Pseudomonas stutzeri]|uniref:DUF6351 family protein n=1 Tax=Stutzerimonas stutzeri TaxID=316 RepID=UPI00210E83F8|nr:DUF6351 family protein [Stutzerimonas stutzeri]MCQ4311205.1 tannase/feruloyl esterase family alpha/beta hydrolase [Stutzerimonas stutzeri]